MIALYKFQDKQTGEIQYQRFIDWKREGDTLTIEDQVHQHLKQSNVEVVDYKYKEMEPMLHSSNLKFECKYCKKEAIHKSKIRITKCNCGALHCNPIYVNQGNI